MIPKLERWLEFTIGELEPARFLAEHVDSRKCATGAPLQLWCVTRGPLIYFGLYPVTMDLSNMRGKHKTSISSNSRIALLDLGAFCIRCWPKPAPFLLDQ